MSVKQIDDNTYVLEEVNSLVSIANENLTSLSTKNNAGVLQKIAIGDSTAEVQTWGKNNKLPAEREFLVAENNIVGELISTKRGIILGSKVIAYKTKYVDNEEVKEFVEMPAAIQQWMDDTNFDQYLRIASKNLLFHANVFSELIMGKGKTQVARIAAKECRHIRAGKMNSKGLIPTYYWSGAWEDSRNGKKPVVSPIPAWDPDKKQLKAILHTGDELLTMDDYYYHPVWWGGRQWVVLANCIPDFHIANLKHGYNIRYHIKIPKDYFAKKGAAGNTQKQKEDGITQEAKAKADFISSMNSFLAGIKNAGRAVFTTFDTNLQYVVGNKYPGIEIEPIKADLQDEALLKLFEKSNQANISAQGIHPTLAAIETAGKLSSGTEIRNAFLMYVAIKTPTIRRILLEPLKLVQKINGWDSELKFWFKDIELAKLDEEKSGKKETVNE